MAALPTAAGARTECSGRGAGRGRRPLLPRRRSLLPASQPRATDTSVVRDATDSDSRHHLRRTQRSMLQQMSSPANVQVGEVATLVRPFEGRLCGEASSGEASAEETDLPQCKIRRNYNCAKCTFYTQNPRAFLVHTRDVHFEKFKIYDCPSCVYASRHHQKLIRHIKMVHGPASTPAKMDVELPAPAPDITEPDRMEDLLEEIEESDDIEIDVDDCNEDTFERSADIEADGDKSAADDGALIKNDEKYFSCTKCSYATHIKARFTKHVKYHSMPLNKCTICDFRSPYKWNLDRHMKNHGGSGSFKCFMCNFTADIKQSLTSHELNHHTPPVGQSAASRRQNRVAASDVINSLVLKEEEGSGDSRSSYSASDMGFQCVDKDVVSCNSDSNDANASDAASRREMMLNAQNQHSPNSSEDAKSHKNNRKIPRPLPQLIPLHASTPTQNKTPPGEPPSKKFKENPITDSTDLNKGNKFENLPVDITLIPVIPPNTKETAGRKKNESFFDKLKERLLTETGEEGSLICKSCGFESKCLSEHSVHEKNCTLHLNRTATNTLLSSLSSTRCQHCRHRCKSSADLFIHMKTCRKNEKIEGDPSIEVKSQDSNDDLVSTQEREVEPHPMENVVFVWNNIHHNANKFDIPLDININDDSTLPEMNRSYDSEIAEDINEGMNLSPSQAMGKKVFKCPHCPFWASTASRFHVHIVGHLNKKPFKCSLCKYKSNWRWDITKHIKLKSARDPEHNEAKVIMTDETGRRNYSKYNKFLSMSVINENGETVFHYLDQNSIANPSLEGADAFNDLNDNFNQPFDMQPLNLQMHSNELKCDPYDNRIPDPKKIKKTLWKCRKCNYRDPSKDALLEHVREHARADGIHEDNKNKKPENLPDPADLAYRCGHCNQLSNWKHVIQRHCRLKHDGIIKVITTVKPKPDPGLTLHEINTDTCNKCPFKATDKKVLLAHLQQHQPSPQSIFKCFFCPFFVKDEHELIQHLALHGITEPEEYIAKAMGRKSPPPEAGVTSAPCTSTKRHKCTECPYETNSKSQFMYHEQFHRLPADTPYKCPECNYSVSKRHLLHQHLRVHGIITKKNESEFEPKVEVKVEINLDEIPFVWVSAKNEFHKMFKCRYCSYVNSQKCKIPNHEKIHCIVFENSDMTVYKCLDCKFTCDSAIRLAEHSRSHGEIYGRIYCPVDEDVPDDEQIAKLRRVIEAEKTSNMEGLPKDDGSESKETKILHFCQKCPARFFAGEELKIHDKFHDLSFPHKCKSCEFSVPEETELSSHIVVHTDEYHTKTKMLKFINSINAAHQQPSLEQVTCANTTEITWIVSNPGKNYDETIHRKSNETKHVPKQYLCKECPAKFFKSSALNYHMGLHGGDGEHKCKKCSYAVKNVGNLAKHELLHENEGKNSTCDYESGEDMDYKNIPLSGTDLFQRKTEAQKRVLNDKDKLVKPNDHFPPVLQADPQFGYLMHGNPEFIYPTYLKNGRQKEKRYKCHKCPSAFEKREQYKIHLSLHGSKQRYKCELCDYSVKYYANYVQHMRKHQMNDEAQAERKKSNTGSNESDIQEQKQQEDSDNTNIKLAIKTMPRGAAKSDFQQFSISDQQTLRLLQRRRSINSSGKEHTSPSDVSPTKDRKLHMCLLCPYTNQRQDALSNHYDRHFEKKAGFLHHTNVHKCSFCDLAVVQSHFLREHIKTHFNYQKNLTPECFVANDDVSFTITKVDEDECTDLKLDTQNKNIIKCNDDKMFVKIQTGEVMVE